MKGFVWWVDRGLRDVEPSYENTYEGLEGLRTSRVKVTDIGAELAFVNI